MATYFHGNSDIQGGGDGLRTLILMNPAYVGYSDAQPPQLPSNLVFLNANSTGNPAATFNHAPPSQTQHFVGIPLQGANSASAASPQDPSQQNVRAGSLPRLTRSDQQRLSLSLSSHQQPHRHGYVSIRSERDVPSQPLTTAVSPPRTDDNRAPAQGVGSPSSASGIFNGVNGVQDVLWNSKYLKAAQQLLDQVVNVGKGTKTATESSKGKSELHIDLPGTETAAASSGDTPDGGSKRGGELTRAERQEIQMKKAKLVNMLDEVDQRYRQYHHQMQIMISWFEQAAGIGSAKTYTALALKTISKQFRCLKDAILGQIRGANKSLREGDEALDLDGTMEGSRLKYVDNQIRQQRALQQLGMIQHNAWRPQRGLPERSVSVLRAWLFQHFLHPYPKDSDKVMLAKQTGLTRSQVSNWFINARVRLWKPMVEEMYTEEMKEHEKNGTDDKARKSKSEQHQDNPTAKSTAAKAKSPGTDHTHSHSQSHMNHPSNAPAISMPIASMSPTTETVLRNIPGFNLIGSSAFENLTQGSPKKLRHIDILHSPASIASINMDTKPPNNNSEHIPMMFDNERQSRDGLTLMGAPTNFIGGFGSYPIADLGRFGVDQFHTPYSGNGVSLTLGLPHCENLSISGAQQTMQLGRGVELGETNDFSGINTPNAHSTNVYENINLQNRKSFGVQLLPDFVALTEQS